MEPHKKLRPLIRHMHWDLLAEVLNDHKKQLVTKLLSCAPEDLQQIQGSVQSLDYILNLKATLTAEETPRKS